MMDLEEGTAISVLAAAKAVYISVRLRKPQNAKADYRRWGRIRGVPRIRRGFLSETGRGSSAHVGLLKWGCVG